MRRSTRCDMAYYIYNTLGEGGGAKYDLCNISNENQHTNKQDHRAKHTRQNTNVKLFEYNLTKYRTRTKLVATRYVRHQSRDSINPDRSLQCKPSLK